MEINIRGDKIEITDSIRDFSESKIRKLEKYFDDHNKMKANILIKTHGKKQTIEVTIPTKHFTLRAEESNNDLYSAVDLVIDKLERQIRKNKTRITNKIQKETKQDLNFDFISDMVESKEKDIVKRKKIDIKPMDEEEAVLQMNLLGHSFFIFKDATTNNISVVYKRKDNHYGIIEVE